MATAHSINEVSEKDLSRFDITRPFYGQLKIGHVTAATIVAQLNKGNRRVRNGLVDYLHRQILNGEWQHDHPQPIVFSSVGRLIDGQHRLIAIAKSGTDVLAMVKTGVRDELREYIDTGISRQLEDRVSFVDDPFQNHKIAQLCNIYKSLISNDRNAGTRPTPTEAFDIFQAHKGSFLFVAKYMSRRVIGLSSVPVMVALSQFWERDVQMAEEFIEGLFSSDSSVQQTRRLREYLLTRKSSAGGSMRQECYQKTVGAMKAFMEGRPVHSLRSASW